MELDNSIPRKIDRLVSNERGDNGHGSEESSLLTDSELSFTRNLRQLVVTAIQEGASDIHLVAYYRPTLRILGRMKAIEGASPMAPGDVQGIFHAITTQEQRLAFQRELEFPVSVNKPRLILQQHKCVREPLDKEGRGIGDVAADEIGLVRAGGRDGHLGGGPRRPRRARRFGWRSRPRARRSGLLPGLCASGSARQSTTKQPAR